MVSSCRSPMSCEPLVNALPPVVEDPPSVSATPFAYQ
jgi:hypothetical protein